MNVLHVLDHSVPLLSGYSLRSRSIVGFERALGLTPVVLTSPKHGSTEDGVEAIEGISYYRTGAASAGPVGRLPFVREVKLMTRLAGRIARVAEREGIDLLHSHSPLLNGLPALWAGRRLGLPVVYEARAFWEDAAVDHGTFKERSLHYRLSRALETFLFRGADRVVTICEGMRRELISRRVEPEKIHVVGNGVDAKWFVPQPRAAHVAEKLGLNGGPVFGFVGSFYHYEGLRFLVEAFPKLVKELPGARLLLVGGGSEEPELRNLARSSRNAIIFAGQVPHASIKEFYSVIDVFVCPRLRMRLTELVTPLKPLEAMAMGKPVLASDVGGHAELIRHGETGLLFSAESQDDFVAQAARAGRSGELRAALGSSARNYVVSERTWERMVSRYLTMYSALV